VDCPARRVDGLETSPNLTRHGQPSVAVDASESAHPSPAWRAVSPTEPLPNEMAMSVSCQFMPETLADLERDVVFVAAHRGHKFFRINLGSGLGEQQNRPRGPAHYF